MWYTAIRTILDARDYAKSPPAVRQTPQRAIAELAVELSVHIMALVILASLVLKKLV
jgi:hypothetical protein